MSRGWESKSVEGQQAEAEASAPEQSAQAMKAKPAGNIHLDADKKRRLQALQLQRERILSERTSSPHRRTALGAALLAIEEELTELGWVLHL
jgi:hypothetical protein